MRHVYFLFIWLALLVGPSPGQWDTSQGTCPPSQFGSVQQAWQAVKPSLSGVTGVSTDYKIWPQVCVVRVQHGNVSDVGSGVLAGGGIVTVAHLFSDAPAGSRIIARFPAINDSVECKLVYADTNTDSAVLSIPKQLGIPPIQVADSDPSPGEHLTVVGHGRSGFRATSCRFSQWAGNGFFVSVPSEQGQSGGAVLNARGALIGLIVGTNSSQTYVVSGRRVGIIRALLRRIFTPRPRVLVPLNPTPNPQPQPTQGPAGPPGEQGPPGAPGKDATISDATINQIVERVVIALRSNQPPADQTGWSHMVMVAPRSADYWSRLNDDFTRAKQHWSIMRHVEPPADRSIGPMPLLVAYQGGKPVKTWSGLRNVEEALSQIARGEFQDKQQTHS